MDVALTNISPDTEPVGIMMGGLGILFPYNTCCDYVCHHAREARGLQLGGVVEGNCCSPYCPHAATPEERQPLLESQRLIRRIASTEAERPAQNGWSNEHIEML